ncbi:TIGR04084 family radical SAM/SPASM domain-containing protein [Infirmifilum sp. SLHALR2]|nr:MAG: putative peptide-modifying radical SAM/SPASM domain-containing protein [Thermofilum sp. NZ13]
MLYIVFTTGRCNLKCDYCGGSFPPSKVPWSISYNPESLKRLVERDPDATVAFYGGEPLLNSRFIRWVMDNVRAKHFVIQTNGTLYKLLPDDYWLRFDTVLLSIDGRPSTTDRHRGQGVYQRVIEAAKHLREIGFQGDLVARMTVTEDTDIYEDVKHLLELNLFSHVHWQLDVVWSDRWKSFERWRDESYLPGLRKLMRAWILEIRKGRVLGIAPFKAIASQAIFGNVYPAPPCGSGVNSVSVLTNGRITACPIAVEERWAELGRLERGFTLKNAWIQEPCRQCPYFRFCGGRCLYAYIERYWGDKGFQAVCRATKELVNLVLASIPLLLSALDKGLIKSGDLLYPPFNNTVEVIP